MKKKVLIVASFLAGHGGEETVIKQFINLMAPEFKIDLLVVPAIGTQTWLNDDHVPLNRLYVTTKQTASAKFSFLLHNLNKSQPDIVICLTPKLLFNVWLIQKILRRNFRILSWIQFTLKNKFAPKILRFLRFADGHLALTREMVADLKDLQIPATKIFLVHNPVLPQNKVIIPAKPTRFLFVGRIEFKGDKNLQELLHALALIEPTQNWQLDIYGHDDSPKQQETQQCKALIAHLHLATRVNWRGFQPQLWQNLQRADCLILPSCSESFGMAVCEAISYGLPVVAANSACGPVEIINNNNGFLYSSGNIQQLSSYLTGFCQHKYQFEAEKVKKSIEPFYTDNYQQNVSQILQHLLKEN
ncbi:glycosyltransferase [Bombilactobacillus thymidiniphilus]|uniref:Glycosyltransferase n=1 Tax=Bombilactobacillus thymidiniphilus TaxID=2923363 RepID=A0ABY4PCB8_9LACO|nr:glycosyltransferase [Bombilactobacillus thymidiniphilus]UQS83294.1 glycosyltransferase [Bombilactobacillus thymidiniphilus]